MYRNLRTQQMSVLVLLCASYTTYLEEFQTCIFHFLNWKFLFYDGILSM
jgi:hypothetical protein